MLTIRQGHASSLADGTPILRSLTGGKRVRYEVKPLHGLQSCDDDLSQASTLTTAFAEAAGREPLDPSSLDFVHPPPRACVCPTCSKIISDPIAGPCGHAYCRACALPAACRVDRGDGEGMPLQS